MTYRYILELRSVYAGLPSHDWTERCWYTYSTYLQAQGITFRIVSYKDGDESGLNWLVAFLEDCPPRLLREQGRHQLSWQPDYYREHKRIYSTLTTVQCYPLLAIDPLLKVQYTQVVPRAGGGMIRPDALYAATKQAEVCIQPVEQRGWDLAKQRALEILSSKPKAQPVNTLKRRWRLHPVGQSYVTEWREGHEYSTTDVLPLWSLFEAGELDKVIVKTPRV